MATVTTPSGEKLEGVTGSLLDYYRGEANTVPGYTIEDDEQAVTFPRVFDGEQYLEPQADATSPAPEPFTTVGEQGPELQTIPLSAFEVDGKHVDLPADDPSI